MSAVDERGVFVESDGYCAVCEAPAHFVSRDAWLRDHYKCERCGSIPRERALLSVLNEHYPGWRDLQIHESSPGASSFLIFARACRGYVITHYFPEVAPGAIKDGLRSENLEAQTFGDDRFDLVITQDVMEHVLDPQAAFREIARTLKPGGAHVFTTPVYQGQTKSEVRARRSAAQSGDQIEYLAEAEYHGNPIDAKGALVTMHYGEDIAELVGRWTGCPTTIHRIVDPAQGIEGEFLEVMVSVKPAALAAGSKVSAVIVNYNGGDFVKEAVLSVLNSTAIAEVILVDNGSSDGSLANIVTLSDRDRRVRCLANGANLGFAAANNRALPMASADAEYLLFLNPDCRVDNNTISRMVKVMAANPKAGMAGCLVTNTDGSEQRGCRRRMPTPASALVRVLQLDRWFPRRFAGFDLTGTPLPSQPAAVEAISGAFMFVRKSALDAVGPLDEGYFLHCEDLDWCMRFRQAGWKILFVPDVRVTHVQGVSSRATPVRVEFHKHRGMARFYSKFYRGKYPLPMLWLVNAGIWLRFVAKAALLLASSGR